MEVYLHRHLALIVSTMGTNLLGDNQCLNEMGSLVNLICSGSVNTATVLGNSFDILLAMDDFVTNGY